MLFFVHFEFTHLYPQLLVWITDIKRRIVFTLGLHTDLFFFKYKICAGLFTFDGLFAIKLCSKDQKY